MRRLVLVVLIGCAVAWFVASWHEERPALPQPGLAAPAASAERVQPSRIDPVLDREPLAPAAVPSAADREPHVVLHMDVIARVVDRSGQPCAGVRVTGVNVRDGGANGAGRFEAVSTTAGLLHLGAAVYAGTWIVRVDDPWILAEPSGGRLRLDPGGLEHRIVVHAPAVGVWGAVVDEQGSPIEGVAVTGPDVMGRSTTSVDGRFAAFRSPRAAGTTAVLEFRKDGRSTVSLREARWGEVDVRVVMPAVAEVVFAVVDDATGAPIDAFDLLLREDASAGPVFPIEQRWSGPHRDGRATVRCSKGRRVFVTAVPRGGEFFAPPFRLIDVGGVSGQEVCLRVHRAAGVQIQVVDGVDEPVPAAEVAVAAPFDASGMSLLTRLVPPAQRGVPLLGDAVVLERGRTDAAGFVRLLAPAAAFPLRIDARGFSSVVVPDARRLRGADGVIRVRLDSAAIVSGRLYPVAALPERARVILGGPRGASMATATVNQDGEFTLAGVPRGRWTLFLSSQQRWGQTRRLGEVDVLSSQVACAFDIAHLGLSRVVGRVRIGAEPLQQGRVAFVPHGVAAPQLAGMSFRPSGSRTAVDQLGLEAPCRDGNFVAELPAGDYRVKIGLPSGDGDGWDWHDHIDVAKVTPGRCDLSLAVPTATLTIRMHGRVVEPVVCTLIGRGFERSFGVGETGTLSVPSIRCGSYLVIARSGAIVRAVPIEVTSGSMEIVVDLE